MEVCGAAVVAAALVYRRAIQRRARYGALTLAAAAPMCAQPVLLLVSDLDGTLAGCASQSTESTANRDESLAALAEFNAAWCARTERTTVPGRCDVVLCYSTGRELHSYVDLVKRLTAYGRTTTEQRHGRASCLTDHTVKRRLGLREQGTRHPTRLWRHHGKRP